MKPLRSNVGHDKSSGKSPHQYVKDSPLTGHALRHLAITLGDLKLTKTTDKHKSASLPKLEISNPQQNAQQSRRKAQLLINIIRGAGEGASTDEQAESLKCTESIFRNCTRAQVEEVREAYHAATGDNMLSDLFKVRAWRNSLDALIIYTRGNDQMRSCDLNDLCELGISTEDDKMFVCAARKMTDAQRISFRNTIQTKDKTIDTGRSIYTITSSGHLKTLTDESAFFHELFPSQLSEVKQGDYGTCYLDSSLLAISRMKYGKYMLAKLITQAEPDSWIVQMPNQKAFHVSRSDIDTHFWERGGVDSDLGIRILESAYGSFRLSQGLKAPSSSFLDELSTFKFGSRKALAAAGTGGYPWKALCDLSGQPSTSVQTIETNENERLFFSKLDNLAKHQSKLAIEASTTIEQNYKGITYFDFWQCGYNPDREHQIVFDHAYTVLGIDASKRTVCLANPWDSSHPFWETYANTRKYFDDIEALPISY